MAENVLIVYSHPYEKSFCHAVLESVERGVEAAGDTAVVCDLYADGFNPALSVEELAVYNKGGHIDPLVGRYIDQIKGAQRIVLVAPIWWNDIPAMMRGWFDKVMLRGFSWTTDEHGWKGLLGSIRRLDLYTTSDNSTEYTRERLGDGLQRTLLDGTCWQLGIDNTAWHNLGSISQTTPEQRAAWLSQVEHNQHAYSAQQEE